MIAAPFRAASLSLRVLARSSARPSGRARGRARLLGAGVLAASAGTLVAFAVCPPGYALCAGEETGAAAPAPSAVKAKKVAGGGKKEGGDAVEAFLRNVAVPAARQVGFSGVVGVCAGAAAKNVGRSVAVGVGVCVVGVQALAYLGWIDVHWGRVEDAARRTADLTGDGVVDENDAVEAWRRLRKVLTFGMASAAGFSAGVVLGLKYF